MSRKSRRRHPHVKRRTAPGSPPGMIEVDPQSPRPVIQVMAFGPDRVEETSIADPARIHDFLKQYPVTWVNVDGLGDGSVLTAIGSVLGIHPLAMEDVIHVGQRSKVDEYETYDFIVLRMPITGTRLETEQLSLFLGERVVITFQELPGDCLEPVRRRIRQGRNRIRNAGPGYLTYALLDAVVDGYFPLLESFGDSLLGLEEQLLENATRIPIGVLYEQRRDIMMLRNILWPIRETMASLARGASARLSPGNEVYLRDLHDHTLQLLERADAHRELAGSLVDLHRSNLTYRMTEVMKVLTIMSSVFIPLTFFAGIWGMNFDPTKSPFNMPELIWRFGYPFALAFMALVAAGLVIYFRRKGWIGRG